MANDTTTWACTNKVAELIRCWDSGMPVPEIAKKLHVTPAAVTGKVHRLDLGKRRQGPGPRKVHANVKREHHVVRAAPLITLEPLASVGSVAEWVRTPPMGSRRDQGEESCCWPMGDGRPWRLCGNDTEPGQHYCATHRRKSLRVAAGCAVQTPHPTARPDKPIDAEAGQAAPARHRNAADSDPSHGVSRNANTRR